MPPLRGLASPGRLEVRLLPAAPEEVADAAPAPAAPLPGSAFSPALAASAPLAAVRPPVSAPYVPGEGLSRLPRPLREPELERPEIYNAGYVGRIRLRLWVAADGQVVEVQVENAAVVPPAVAAAVRQVLLRTPFLPAERDGVTVAATLRIALEIGPPGAPLPSQ